MSYQVLRNDVEGGVELKGNPQPAPPGYMYVPLAADQQTTTVVASQPRTLPKVSVVEPQLKPKPAMLIFSLVLTIVCGVHLCLPAFVCLTPALVFAIVGYSLSDSKEQKSTAKAFHGVSLCCNIASIVYYVLAAIATIVTLSIMYALYWRPQHYEFGCWEDCSPRDYVRDYGSGYYDYGFGCVTVCS